MTSMQAHTELTPKEQQAQQYLTKGDYSQAANCYRQAIEAEPEVKSHFWNLGLMLLLQGQEAEAQSTWKLGMAEGELEQIKLLQGLNNILQAAPLHPGVLKCVEASLPYIREPHSFFNVLIPATIKIAHSIRQPKTAARLLTLGLRLEPKNLEVLRYLAGFYINAGDYSQGIETAKLCYSLSDKLIDQLYAVHLLQRGLMEAPDSWQEARAALQQLEDLLQSLFKEQPTNIEPDSVLGLFNANYFAPYLRDDAQKNRQIQNQLAQFAQRAVQNYASEQVKQYQQRTSGDAPSGQAALRHRTGLLKIGYVSHCLCIHSVGWLARWLFQYHDRSRFQIYAYFINSKQGDPLQHWYTQQVTKAYKGGIDGKVIAQQIYQDEIDILIDLDSITVDVACEIMSLKPAPVQVTWLGWDASGIPGVDYFIADPYVLPESAQEYYAEKIWRLPQTYIAVDGFEVGVPTQRRDHLGIPNDAVVYLSAQRGFKRHPETARLQMKIIKQVPNSYFLIKGFAEAEGVKKFFMQLAQEEGVSGSRLRFLPLDPTESAHRANFTIADVVLDTFPYNGATTTLETLWMGIPLVTRVGQQFAARNSYTMMINAGITEGIAWTDEEYVEWGVRLGKDATLRQQVAWKLRQSRHTAPLWNARQFTCEMEKAYEQMWNQYT
ncbi:tetratricopeptide repeat protein [Iningainema tapete]|uniref:protein O-GlcNAc transferase n=1 Tax=Iningainema tapete BLCC-T55 TaxID=2748662 RepID=A0A8J6XEY0_9CYAN|nr:tetratricopeptide repeat protein [Iningainema tapete]MBD2771505.1 O-linked N-acetylglucosamine transferase, SPINDLY family protein [Iningainema tapete BLCC-T55]